MQRKQRLDAAIKAAKDYAEIVAEIFKRTSDLKDKEDEQAAALKRVYEAKLKIMEAERQTAIIAAGGNKVEEARINAIYKHAKTQTELERDQADIDLKKTAAKAQADDARKKAAAADKAAAEQQKAERGVAGAEKLKKELPGLEADTVAAAAARKDANFMANLREAMAQGKQYYETPTGESYDAADLARYEALEENYIAAQQREKVVKEAIKKADEALQNANKEVSKTAAEFKESKTRMDVLKEVTQGEAGLASEKRTVATVATLERGGLLSQAGLAPGKQTVGDNRIAGLVERAKGIVVGSPSTYLSAEDTALMNNLRMVIGRQDRSGAALKKFTADLLNHETSIVDTLQMVLIQIGHLDRKVAELKSQSAKASAR
jgi:hypothetical protein